MIGQQAHDRNQDATLYVGNLDAAVTEELVWELFVQTGPVVNVFMPKDRVAGVHQGYGFVEYRTEQDADYVRARDRTGAFGLCARWLMGFLRFATALMRNLSALLMLARLAASKRRGASCCEVTDKNG